MKTVVFIVGQLSQPRCIKRIESVQKAGIPIKVYGYNNGLYEENLKKNSFVPTGYLENKGNIFMRRMSPYLQIRKIFKENSHSVFYVFGYHLADILYTVGCRSFIYEEADVNSAKKKSWVLQKIAILRDKYLALNSLFTVYTSQGFVDYLFPSTKKPQYILLQNKLSNYFISHNRDAIKPKRVDIKHIRFAFIGLIRYPNTIGRFARIIAEEYPQHEFHFYGDKSLYCELPKIVYKANNIFFHGAFKNPVDLESIYRDVDINIACYDAQSRNTAVNVRIAEPNKLFESIYFLTPIIVSKDTFIGKRVLDLGVGDELLSHDDESIRQFINGITSSKIEAMINAELNIPKDQLIDNPKELINRILSLV